MNTIEQVKETINGPSAVAREDSLGLLDILLVLVRNRRMIGAITLGAFCAGVLLSVLLRPKFTAKAVIMPPQQQTSSSALLSQLGSMASLGGGAAALGLKSPADLYIGILQSRTIADNIISTFGLQTVYKQKHLVDTRAILKAHAEIESGKDGLIQISVTEPDPKLASQLANAYVQQLYVMNSNLAITEAAQRRVFFDQQLDEEKKALTAAEENLRTTQQKTGVIQLNGQAQMIIQTIAQLRAEIANREVQEQSIRTYATDQNPEVARLDQEISTMRSQLAKLEDDQRRQPRAGDIAVPAGRVAQDTLEYVRMLRELKYHETLFDLLSRQYEAARIDEAKSAPIIQVVDHAVPPDKKSSPNRTLIVLGFVIFGFACSSAIAFTKNSIHRAEQEPEQAAKLDYLRSQLGRHR